MLSVIVSNKLLNHIDSVAYVFATLKPSIHSFLKRNNSCYCCSSTCLKMCVINNVRAVPRSKSISSLPKRH